jgi:hypothetical protein
VLSAQPSRQLAYGVEPVLKIPEVRDLALSARLGDSNGNLFFAHRMDTFNE